jgi:hypothetical protein
LLQSINQGIKADRVMYESLPSNGRDIPGVLAALRNGQDEAQKHWPLNEKGVVSTMYESQRSQVAQYAQLAANRALTYVATRLLSERVKTHSLPETLPDYGKLGLDPNTGKPLEYRRLGSGFTLTSTCLVGRPLKFK